MPCALKMSDNRDYNNNLKIYSVLSTMLATMHTNLIQPSKPYEEGIPVVPILQMEKYLRNLLSITQL